MMGQAISGAMKTNKKPTAGIILAAGMSTRLGQTKQLLKLKGRYLIEWVISAPLASQLDKTILVLGHEQQQILDIVEKNALFSRLQIVLAPDYRQGMSQSLKAGLLAAREGYPSVMFLLGDQPLVTSNEINRLLGEFWNSEKEICVPVHRGKRGNPVIFGQALYDELHGIQGDIGARDLIDAHGDRVHCVETEEPASFLDIDTGEDVKKVEPLLP
jgi:molybdenum cofactor cytidylyltransferase